MTHRDDALFDGESRAARRALRDDVRSELESHLALSREALIAEGLDPEAARLEANRRFGNIDAIEERCLLEKRSGERVMKTLVTVLAVGFVALSVAFALTTVRLRREALEREHVAQAFAHELADERSRSRTSLLGADDSARPGDIVQLVSDVVSELNLRVQVDSDGSILLPEIGRVMTTDVTRAELESSLAEAYAPLYVHPVEVFVQIERAVERD
ncbi:MAG: permease prefix domain 1-containing protein [Planctomycetota bacterium]